MLFGSGPKIKQSLLGAPLLGHHGQEHIHLAELLKLQVWYLSMSVFLKIFLAKKSNQMERECENGLPFLLVEETKILRRTHLDSNEMELQNFRS